MSDLMEEIFPGAEPVKWEDIGRTPEQKALLTELINLVSGNIGQGATPFAGQLSAQPHQAQLDAMNMMGSIGGAGPYGVPDMPYWGTGPMYSGTWSGDDEGGDERVRPPIEEREEPIPRGKFGSRHRSRSDRPIVRGPRTPIWSSKGEGGDREVIYPGQRPPTIGTYPWTWW